MKFPELLKVWNLFKNLFTFLIVFIAFFVLVEVLHIYQILSSLHPFFGITFALLSMAGLGWLSIKTVQAFLSLPVVLRPPVIKHFDGMTLREARAYARYLIHILDRIARSEHLKPDVQQAAGDAGNELTMLVRKRASLELLCKKLQSVENDIIFPSMEILKAKAWKIIWASTRDAGIGVAVSPYHTMDMVIVLYKNFKMMYEVMKVFEGRPNVFGMMFLCRDVGMAVVTVSFLGIGSKFVQKITASVAGVGMFYDDIVQGFGAALMTGVIGNATVSRCSSVRGWDKEATQLEIKNNIGNIHDYLKNLMTMEMIPLLRRRKQSHLAQQDPQEENSFWEMLTQKVAEAVEATKEAAGNYIGIPVESGMRSLKAISSARGAPARSSAPAAKKESRLKYSLDAFRFALWKAPRAVGSGIRNTVYVVIYPFTAVFRKVFMRSRRVAKKVSRSTRHAAKAMDHTLSSAEENVQSVIHQMEKQITDFPKNLGVQRRRFLKAIKNHQQEKSTGKQSPKEPVWKNLGHKLDQAMELPKDLVAKCSKWDLSSAFGKNREESSHKDEKPQTQKDKGAFSERLASKPEDGKQDVRRAKPQKESSETRSSKNKFSDSAAFSFFEKITGWHHDGIHKSYWRSGVIREECSYQENHKHGEAKRYYPDGTLEAMETYQEGKLHGPYRKYHPDGKLEEEGMYRNDKMDGLCRLYDQNGKLSYEIDFSYGNEVGVRVFKDGKPQEPEVAHPAPEEESSALKEDLPEDPTGVSDDRADASAA